MRKEIIDFGAIFKNGGRFMYDFTPDQQAFLRNKTPHVRKLIVETIDPWCREHDYERHTNRPGKGIAWRYGVHTGGFFVTDDILSSNFSTIPKVDTGDVSICSRMEAIKDAAINCNEKFRITPQSVRVKLDNNLTAEEVLLFLKLVDSFLKRVNE